MIDYFPVEFRMTFASLLNTIMTIMIVVVSYYYIKHLYPELAWDKIGKGVVVCLAFLPLIAWLGQKYVLPPTALD